MAKVFNVKKNPPRRTRREIVDKTNVGFTEAYKINPVNPRTSETAEEREKYREGWERIWGNKKT